MLLALNSPLDLCLVYSMGEHNTRICKKLRKKMNLSYQIVYLQIFQVVMCMGMEDFLFVIAAKGRDEPYLEVCELCYFQTVTVLLIVSTP